MTALRIKAICVHLLTGVGAVLALLSLEAASRSAWAEMMGWLVIAFVIDGIDGPLARHYNVKENAPEWDGVLLDLIIDYLTYVLIPAYALWQSGIMSAWEGGVIAGLITYSSVIYFADTRMKTKDNSFSGFPGCWNMVVVVFFAVEPPHWMIWVVTLILMVAMFLPLKFVHPVRTKKWRSISLPIALLWTLFAGISAWQGFQSNIVIEIGLVATSIYLVFVGIVQDGFSFIKNN